VRSNCGPEERLAEPILLEERPELTFRKGRGPIPWVGGGKEGALKFRLFPGMVAAAKATVGRGE
jgi:hypothetical protein